MGKGGDQCVLDLNTLYLILDLTCGILTAIVALDVWILPQFTGYLHLSTLAVGLLFFTTGLLIVITCFIVCQCVVTWMRFFMAFVGRAITYIWVGLIYIGGHWGYQKHGTSYGLRFATGVILLVVGFLYVILAALGHGTYRYGMYTQSSSGFTRTTKRTTYSTRA